MAQNRLFTTIAICLIVLLSLGLLGLGGWALVVRPRQQAARAALVGTPLVDNVTPTPTWTPTLAPPATPTFTPAATNTPVVARPSATAPADTATVSAPAATNTPVVAQPSATAPAGTATLSAPAATPTGTAATVTATATPTGAAISATPTGSSTTTPTPVGTRAPASATSVPKTGFGPGQNLVSAIALAALLFGARRLRKG